jgi:hypothetical protein
VHVVNRFFFFFFFFFFFLPLPEVVLNPGSSDTSELGSYNSEILVTGCVVAPALLPGTTLIKLAVTTKSSRLHDRASIIPCSPWIEFYLIISATS